MHFFNTRSAPKQVLITSEVLIVSIVYETLRNIAFHCRFRKKYSSPHFHWPGREHHNKTITWCISQQRRNQKNMNMFEFG